MVIHMLFNSTLSGMSGGDKRALEVLSYICKNNVDCTVYSPSIFAQTIRDFGVSPTKTVITSSKKSQKRNLILRYILHTFKAMQHIPSKLNGITYYCTSAYLPDILPAIRGKKLNKNCQLIVPVFHLIEHYRTRPGGKLNNLIAYCEQKWGLRLVKKNADSILVINALVKEQLVKDGFDKDRIRLVDCGIDSELVNASQPHTDTEKIYDAVFMGRLAPSKGVFELAEIWSKVKTTLPHARLAIIGKGEAKVETNLKAQFDEFGLSDNVDFLGFLDSHDAYSYMKSAKLFVFPSHEEGWGIAIAEAMACGLPAITYDLPVFKYIFNGISQEAPLGDTGQMADLIIDLLKNEPHRTKLSKEGQELVFRQYTWDVIVKNELEFLFEMDRLRCR